MKNVSLRSDSMLPFEDGISSGLSLGLIAVTLPTVGYAVVRLTHLLSGGTLEQAVRAFAQ